MKSDRTPDVFQVEVMEVGIVLKPINLLLNMPHNLAQKRDVAPDFFGDLEARAFIGQSVCHR
jgi:hypothetical protein